MAETTNQTSYWLDAEDRIVRVSPQWDSFARENDGDLVLADTVVGHPLTRFVTGDPTRMWIHAVFALARARHDVVERPYRCDSPDLRRYMRMTVTPEAEDLLRVDHVLLATEPRPYPVHVRSTGKRARGLPLRCSICGRIKTRDQWRERDEMATASGAEPLITVAYTVCEACQFLPPRFTQIPRPA